MGKHMLALPALVVLLAGSAAGVTAQDEAGAAGLVTEEVEPGVERIVSDAAGHDLDEKHPTYRYDMDGIAITRDGTVWLTSTYSRTDNEANPDGPLVWALGQPGTYSVEEGIPATSPTFLYAHPDGRLFVIAYDIVSFRDGAFSPDFEWVGPPSQIEEQQAVLLARPDGGHSCRSTGYGVTCEDPSGEVTRYISSTPINQIAAAPDGTVWAVGGYDGDNGGLYRITLE